MNKRILFSALAMLFLVFGAITPVCAEKTIQSQVLLSEEIPHAIIVLACQAVEKEKIANADVAMCWYRAGLMTITKVDSGVYAVVLPGGDQIGILISDVL